jgi:hypothetical protein
MIENPFLIPPQVEGPQSRSWGRGFAFGFKGPVESVQPGVDFDVEDVDAFNQGTVFGQDLAIQGLIFTDNPCVDLNREPPPDIPELVFNGRDIASVVPKIPKFSLKLSGVVFGAITTFIDLSIALKTHFDDPNQALQEYGTRLRDLLMAMHRGTDIDFFIGCAVDLDRRGCELAVTRIFRDPGPAAAALELGRPGPNFLVEWVSDQPGVALLVESGVKQ